jgi:hypothetical protein
MARRVNILPTPPACFTSTIDTRSHHLDPRISLYQSILPTSARGHVVTPFDGWSFRSQQTCVFNTYTFSSHTYFDRHCFFCTATARLYHSIAQFQYFLQFIRAHLSIASEHCTMFLHKVFVCYPPGSRYHSSCFQLSALTSFPFVIVFHRSPEGCRLEGVTSWICSVFCEALPGFEF